ncbi:MAG TPA: hypothetical protein VK489_02235 [Ferruginibacter sp.]|nr:hypothetical protein [Ferruginibacter sp.]
MKQTLLLLTLIAGFSLTSTAQIRKGATLLGGQISFNHTDADNNTAQQYNSAVFHIAAGKAYKENSVLGLYMQYAHSKVSGSFASDFYRAGFFYRKFHKLAKDFYFFGEMGTGYMGSKEKRFGVNEVSIYQSGVELDVTAGLSYRVYKKLHVEVSIPQLAGIHYSVAKTSSVTGNSKQDSFGFHTNLNGTVLNAVAVGFRFVL